MMSTSAFCTSKATILHYFSSSGAGRSSLSKYLLNMKTYPHMFTKHKILSFPYSLFMQFFYFSAEETGEMLYLTVANTFFTQVPRAWRLAFLVVKNKRHDLIPNSRLCANNIDVYISVDICPPLVAACHKAAAASSSTGLTSSHCCLPRNENRRQRRCRASGERLQQDSKTSSSWTTTPPWEITRFKHPNTFYAFEKQTNLFIVCFILSIQ